MNLSQYFESSKSKSSNFSKYNISGTQKQKWVTTDFIWVTKLSQMKPVQSPLIKKERLKSFLMQDNMIHVDSPDLAAPAKQNILQSKLPVPIHFTTKILCEKVENEQLRFT